MRFIIDDSMIHPAGQHPKQHRNLSRSEYRCSARTIRHFPILFPGRSQSKSVIKSPLIISFPAGARMKYRSNIPKYSEFVFENVDASFAKRAMTLKEAESTTSLWPACLTDRDHPANMPPSAPCIWVFARLSPNRSKEFMPPI